MQPYARSHKVGIAKDVHHAIGFTDKLTKRGLAAKKPTKHGARQEAKMAIKKGSWEALFGHLGTPEEVAREWMHMQEELIVYRLQNKIKEIQEQGSDAERVRRRLDTLKGQVGEPCSRCLPGKMFLDTNGYSYFFRCDTCGLAPFLVPLG